MSTFCIGKCLYVAEPLEGISQYSGEAKKRGDASSEAREADRERSDGACDSSDEARKRGDASSESNEAAWEYSDEACVDSGATSGSNSDARKCGDASSDRQSGSPITQWRHLQRLASR